jgi:4-amino-4-deoxy-L-arabinose transferase-like glycosyltransferase
MKILKNNKWLSAILLVALIIRIFYFLNSKPWESSFMESQFTYNDSRGYHNLAVKIVETKSFPVNISLDTYRTPIFPLYIAFFYLIFGIKPYTVLFSYIILNLISVVFIYLLTKKLFNNKILSLIAVVLYAFEPNIIRLTIEFGTEILHATLMIISVYYFVVGLKDKKYSSIIISGILFGISVLTRPVNLYFYILCIIFILSYREIIMKQRIKIALLFVSAYLLSISPWMLRNYIEYGYFSTCAVQGSQMLYNAGVTKSYETGIRLDSINNEFHTILNNRCEEKNITNYFDIDKQSEIIGFEYLINHLNPYIYLHLKGMVKFFASPLDNIKYSFVTKILIGSYLFLIYLFYFIGIYFLFKEKEYYNILFFSSIILYFCFLTGVIGLSRYRTPTTAFYLIISAYGIYFLFNKLKLIFIKNKI